MKLLLVTLITILTVAPASAQTVKKHHKKAVEASTSTDTYEKSDPFRLRVGPSIGVAAGTFSLGVNADLLFKISPDLPLEFGFESGASFYLPAGGFGVAIPILVTSIYQFSMADSRVQPYLGMGAGIGIISGVVASEVLVRPGISFGTMYFEPQFGLFATGFIFVPTFGFTF